MDQISVADVVGWDEQPRRYAVCKNPRSEMTAIN